MKPYYYIYKHGDQGPRVRHATIAEAQAEAERLAAKEPGRAFEILRCVGIAQCSQASTFWMDGEGPPEKPRYRELEEGETIEENDEYFARGQWQKYKTEGCIGEVYVRTSEKFTPHLPHRRPL